MKLTPKTLKKLVIGLSICLILFGVWSTVTSVGYSKKRANYEAEKQERLIQIAVLETKASSAYDEARTEKARADSLEVDKKELLARLEVATAVVVEEIEAVPEMTNVEVASETRTILEMPETDIFANELGLQFSLVASQRNLQGLKYLEFYIGTEKPSMLEYIEKIEIQYTSISEGYKNLEIAYLSSEEAREQMREQIIASEEMTRAAEKRAARARIKAVVTTVIYGAVIYAVIKLIIILVK